MKFMDIKIPIKDENQQFLIDLISNHGGISATQNIVRQLEQVYDQGIADHPGEPIPDYWSGYKAAIRNITQILEGPTKL